MLKSDCPWIHTSLSSVSRVQGLLVCTLLSHSKDKCLNRLFWNYFHDFPFSSQELSVLFPFHSVITAHFYVFLKYYVSFIILTLWIVKVLSFVEEETDTRRVQQLFKGSRWGARSWLYLISCPGQRLTSMTNPMVPFSFILRIMRSKILSLCPHQLHWNSVNDTFFFWGRGEANLSLCVLHPELSNWQVLFSPMCFLGWKLETHWDSFLWMCGSIGSSSSFDVCQHGFQTFWEVGSPGATYPFAPVKALVLQRQRYAVCSNAENKTTNWSFICMIASEPQLVCGLGVMIVSLLQIKMLSTQEAWELSRFPLLRSLPWWTWQCSLFPKANYRTTDPFSIVVWGPSWQRRRNDNGLARAGLQLGAAHWVEHTGWSTLGGTVKCRYQTQHNAISLKAQPPVTLLVSTS